MLSTVGLAISGKIECGPAASKSTLFKFECLIIVACHRDRAIDTCLSLTRTVTCFSSMCTDVAHVPATSIWDSNPPDTFP